MKKIFLAIQIFMVILLAGCGRIEERPPQIVKISAGGDHSAVLLDDGSVIAWGDNIDGRRVIANEFSDVIDISVGFNNFY